MAIASAVPASPWIQGDEVRPPQHCHCQVPALPGLPTAPDGLASPPLSLPDGVGERKELERKKVAKNLPVLAWQGGCQTDAGSMRGGNGLVPTLPCYPPSPDSVTEAVQVSWGLCCILTAQRQMTHHVLLVTQVVMVLVVFLGRT